MLVSRFLQREIRFTIKPLRLCRRSKPKYTVTKKGTDLPPQQIINNLYANVARSLGYKTTDSIKTVNYSKGNRLWKCKVHVTWPQELTLENSASRQNVAYENVCRTLLGKILDDTNMDETSKFLNPTEKITECKKIQITLSEDKINAVKQLWKAYNSGIKQTFQEAEECGLFYDNQKLAEFDTNNNFQNNRLYVVPEGTPLPVDNYKDEIIEAVANNRVVCIKGDTGCGKSVRVPQIILNNFIENYNSSISSSNDGDDDTNIPRCSILLVQPRRITAESVAKRIAELRGETIGNTVGFQVRLKSVLPRNRSFILCLTEGVLIKRIMNDKVMSGITHVILDEVHERSQYFDVLLLLIKDLMKYNENIRLILMSATINTKLFFAYFSSSVLISVLGRNFHVNVIYADPICKSQRNLIIDYGKLAAFVRSINEKSVAGTILCFLPKIADTYTMKQILKDDETMEVNICHSKLPYHVQSQVFASPAPDRRKIVFCTNVCEVGITVPNVSVVIDVGLENTLTYNKQTGNSTFKLTYISKAAAEQRKGRAGRMLDGTCYRLYTEEMYEQFSDYKTCAIMSEPLDNILLLMRSLYPEKSFSEALSGLIEPPSLLSVETFVNKLKNIRILDEEENLTAIGKRINPVPSNVEFVELLLLSVFYKCLGPVVTMLPVISDNIAVIYHNGSENTNTIFRNIKLKYCDFSDHIACYKIYNEWEQFGFDGILPDVKPFFNIESAKLIKEMKEYYENWLIDINMVERDKLSEYDENVNDELISGILCSTFPFILKDDFRCGEKKLKRSTFNQYGHITILSKKTVNFINAEAEQMRIYVASMEFPNKPNISIVHDITRVHPLTFALFYPGNIKVDENGSTIKILSDTKCNIVIPSDKESVETILQLREMMKSSYRYFVRVAKFEDDLEFFAQLRNTVVDILPKRNEV